MKMIHRLLCLLVLFFGAFFYQTSVAAQTPEVEMLTDNAQLDPASTLEFRFATAMVSRDSLGVADEKSPVIFSPSLAGKFTWLSTRSGVFVPDAAPPLGVTFKITVRRDLTSADGKPLGKTFSATLKTPPFTVFRSGNTGNSKTTSPNPDVRFAFNLAVDLKSAENLFQFIAANGEKISGKVRYATGEDYFSLGVNEGDWEERWELARNPAAKKSPTGDESEEERKKPQPSRLVISPATPLTSGTKWEVRMAPGISSTNGKYQLADSLELTLGMVEPFVIQSVESTNQINTGRSLTVNFSDGIAPDFSQETASDFLKITPEVKNLHANRDYSAISIHGDFVRGVDYQITFLPKLVSDVGLPVEGAKTRSFRFDAINPRLYLPEITGTQIRRGLRKFLVRSVNLRKLKVTARSVSSADLPKAVDAFSAYYKDYDEKNPDEMYQPLKPDVIPGKVLKETTFDLADQIDIAQTTELDWDKIVGAKNAGAIYLTVEGEPLAAIGGKNPGAQSLVQLTDLGILWKKSADGLRVNVFSLATGEPVPGVSLVLMDKDYQSKIRAVSDAKGEAQLPVPPGIVWLVADQADDNLALRMGDRSDDLPTAGFNLPIDYNNWDDSSERDDLRGLIFTDRPLYRPGETVKIKGYLRVVGDRGLEIFASKPGKLKLKNAKGEQIDEKEVNTDRMGNLDGELTLSASDVGRQSIVLEIDDKTCASASFAVADFQPNAFELKATLPDRLPPTAKLTAEVSARYFFGATLSQAQVRWTLRQAVVTEPPEGFQKFQLPISDEGPLKMLSLHGETTLDAEGNCVISPQLPDPSGTPMKNILTIEATDLNQQTVSESRMVIQDSSDYYLGIATPEESVLRVGEKLPVRVIAISPSGEPLTKPVKVKSEIIFKRHDAVRVQGAGNAISFRTESSEEIISSAEGNTLTPEKEADEWNVRDGESANLKTGKPGDYGLRVTSIDSHGKEARTEWDFYVAGAGETVWDMRNPAQIDLVPDKATYRSGETARILVKAPISGEALLSIQQRDRILRTQRIKLEGNAPVIEVPLNDLDAPNVFVEMILIRGTDQSTRKFKMPEYRHGICRLNVTQPENNLQVDILPGLKETQPGEEQTAEITVRDGLGKPMLDAEVTFFAVDDGILALTGYERPDPRQTFSAPWPLNVRTGISISDLLPENPEDLVYANKGYLIGGGGLEGPGLKLRRDFPGTLAWLPSLKTDANGKITVKFKVPDALTRYRLVAVASALTDYFGSGESSFLIKKPLSLLPSIGQFANVGDQILARCVVRNDTGADGSAEVTLVLDATAESDKPLTVSIPVKNNTAAAVDFPVRLRAMGTANWQWTAKIATESKIFEDAVVSSMTVGSASVLLRETYLTDLSNKTNDLLQDINPQLLEGTATVTVANTRLANLRESGTQLLEYPYGCSEQTASALIPWLAIKDLRPILPQLVGKDEKKAIQSSVDKLFAMQTSSGGLAYWPGGQIPSLFASAYASVALATLEKQGCELPPGWEKLTAWLSSQLRDMDKIRFENDLSDRALALFALALAGRAEPAYHEILFNRRAELSRETRALLALAVAQSGGAKDVIATLLDERTPAPESFSWFGGEARERAIRLLAWSRFNPKSGEIPKLVKELLAYRKNGEWGTTQQNAWALMALSEYFTSVEKGGKDVSGVLLANQQKIPFTVTKKNPSETQVFDFTPDKPLVKLAVENPRKTALFGETRFVVRPPVANQPRQNRGYAVSRSYQKLTLDGKLLPADGLKVGDRILVTLRLETPRPGHFVAIDDPLPAIFEAVNPAFKTQSIAGGDSLGEDWTGDYREIRKDRVLIFCDHLPAGAFTFTYLARVRSAGTVTAPATQVQEMYRPERFGLGETLELTSR